MVEFNRELVFEAIYDHNLWCGEESRSGTGSDTAQTVTAKKILANIINEYNIASMLDIPCGDYHWIRDVKLPKGFEYIGADVVGKMIDDNRDKYPDVRFEKLDIVCDPLPKNLDLIFVRDLLGHLSHFDTVFALDNIRKAKPRYVVATTFPNATDNPHIKTGQWRPINLEHYGWYPILLFSEGHLNDKGEDSGKSLGLYMI